MTSYVGGNEGYSVEKVNKFVGSVYNYMGTGLLVSGATATIVASIPELFYSLMMTPLRWIIIFAPLGLLFAMSWASKNKNTQTVRNMYWAFVVLLGISLSSLFVLYTTESIFEALFIAGAVYYITGFYGTKTKRNLSGMGQFMMFALIGVIIASIVNLFMGNGMLQMIISYAIILVFSGLNAYDHQQLKTMASYGYNDENSAIQMAASLYLNFINLFSVFLTLMGNRE